MELLLMSFVWLLLFVFFVCLRFLACFPSHRLPRRPFSHPGPTSHAHAFIRNGAFVFGLGTLILYVLVLIKAILCIDDESQVGQFLDVCIQESERVDN